jgi:hypothetical protein
MFPYTKIFVNNILVESHFGFSPASYEKNMITLVINILILIINLLL